MDEETNLKIDKWLDSPEGRQSQQKLRADAIHSMLVQAYPCSVATIRVQRCGNAITITWTFHEHIKNPGDYLVIGVVRRIDYTPTPENLCGQNVTDGKGNGTVTVTLREGSCFSFLFTLHKFMSDCYDDLHMVHFIVGVPLSDDKRRILEKVLKLDEHPEERIRDSIEMHFRKQDAFEEMHQKGIARIKAKNLPEEEEQEQLEELKEEMVRIRDSEGM